jgi:hypothetical protein
MTPIETTEKFLAHLNLNEDELREIRDIADELAETIIRGYWARHKLKHGKTSNVPSGTGVSETRLLSDSGQHGKEAIN